MSEKEVLTPADLRREVLVTFPRLANPALADRLSSLMDAAGYRFRDVHEASGTDERDLLLAVAAGHGVSLTAASTEDIGEIPAKIVRRPLDPPLSLPDTVLASRAAPPRRLRPAGGCGPTGCT